MPNPEFRTAGSGALPPVTASSISHHPLRIEMFKAMQTNVGAPMGDGHARLRASCPDAVSLTLPSFISFSLSSLTGPHWGMTPTFLGHSGDGRCNQDLSTPIRGVPITMTPPRLQRNIRPRFRHPVCCEARILGTPLLARGLPGKTLPATQLRAVGPVVALAGCQIYLL